MSFPLLDALANPFSLEKEQLVRLSRTVSFWMVVLALTARPLLAQQVKPAPRITQYIDATDLVRLTGSTHPLARAEYDQGSVPPDLPMDRILLLLRRSPEQETSLRQ